jgi:carbon monoxide dehydrogenase subunit G
MCHNALVATVRRELRIPRSADEIWEIVGDAGALHEWFPGVVSTKVGRDDRG